MCNTKCNEVNMFHLACNGGEWPLFRERPPVLRLFQLGRQR